MKKSSETSDTVAAGQPLIDMVKLCYGADMPLLLIGSHGVGKSELLRQAAQEMGIGCIVRDLSIMEPADLSGLPKMKGQQTTYLPPEFLPRNGKGLLVIEELNRAEKYMRAPCLQLLTERTLNDYRLPAGWLPVAAVNPSEGGDYHVEELDPALLSRFTRVTVVPDRSQWLAWAQRSNIHLAVRNYVATDDSAFAHEGSNPRAWTYVSRIMIAADKDSTEPELLRAAVRGILELSRGEAFLASLQHSDKPLKADQILRSYASYSQSLRRWVANGQIDLVSASLRAIELHLQPENDFDAVRKRARQWKNLAMFLGDLPPDLAEEADQFFKARDYELPQLKRRKSRTK